MPRLKQQQMMQKTRRLRYQSHTYLKALLFPHPIDAFARLFIRHDSVLGVQVAHIVSGLLENPLDFTQEIVAAFQLLERVDLTSYKRVLKYCRRIYGTALPWDAAYSGSLKTCYINTERLSLIEPGNRAVCLAELLSHEAIHGLLHGKLIPHTKRLLPRIEGICVKRQLRFLKLCDSFSEGT